LDWIGLDWIGLDWIGLDWIGLDWIGLDGLAGCGVGADPVFQVCPTSYDCDAPLSEAGDTTDKYLAVRKFTSQVII